MNVSLYECLNVLMNVRSKKVNATVPCMKNSLMSVKQRKMEYAYGKLKKHRAPGTESRLPFSQL